MAKKAYLAHHYTSEELKQKYRSSQDQVEAKRWHLLWKISLGWSIKNSAIAVGLNYDYAKEILKRYNEQGSEGVKNQRKNRKKRGGKKPLLKDLQLEKLKIALESKPSDGGIWTGAKVARWIEKETGLEKVWDQRGWEYLKKCNYSWQRPRPKHRKGDEDQQQQFKENLPKKVKQLQEQYPDSEIEVWFFDEHRVGLKPKWLNKVYEQFAIDVGINEGKKVLLIEDQAGWHRSEKAIRPEGIINEFLPPYSPELQPAERLWNLVDEPLVNEHFEAIEEIEKILVERCNVLRVEMKTEIKNLTDYHWFDYA